MIYTSTCGAYKYHFHLVEAGWSLLCYGRDPLYVVPDIAAHRYMFAKHRARQGDHFVLPIFAIDYINPGIVNIVVDAETTGPEETRALVRCHVNDLDDELELGLGDAIGDDVWKSFLIGLNKTRSFRRGSMSSVLVAEHTPMQSRT